MRLAYLLAVVCLYGCGGGALEPHTDGGPSDTCGAKPDMTQAFPVGSWSTSGESIVDNGGADGSIHIDMMLDSGRRLIAMSALLSPGPHDAVPERTPWFSLFGSEEGTVGTAFDLSSTPSEYSSQHKISLDLSHFAWSPDSAQTYWVRFGGEGGAGAMPGGIVSSWECSYATVSP